MKRKTKAFVFDFDDTLAHTSAMVLDGPGVDKFAEFKLDFPILNAEAMDLIELAQSVHDEGHSVYILTARNECVSNAIATWLSKWAIEAKAIHCVGSHPDVNIAKAKRRVLLSVIENHDIVYFFDDNDENIELARKLNLTAKKVENN
jgi:acid phosphatase class B